MAVVITDANIGGSAAANGMAGQARRSCTGAVATWSMSRNVTSSGVNASVIIGAQTAQPPTTAVASSAESQRTATRSPPTAMASPVASPAITGRKWNNDVEATASR